MDILFQIGLLFLLVFLNGYFVASEFSLISVRKTRVDELAKLGYRSAKRLQKALKDLDRYISATQLGITLASLGLGWVGEPALAHLIEPAFSFLPQQAAYVSAHGLAVATAFLIITFLHIVLGELAPKSIALQHAEGTALIVVTPLLWFSQLFHPFIVLLNGAGHVVLKLLGIHRPKGHTLVHSEEEIRMLLRQSSLGGAIPTKEVEIVYNVFQLGDIPVKHIMVPRTEIVALKASLALRDVIKRIDTNPHSRFPVFDEELDGITGFVHVKDIYRQLLKHGVTARLSELPIIREIISVPEIKKIDKVLQDMRAKRIHLAIVTDEYGRTTGLVTLEDIIESLVGEIDDEFDTPVKTFQKHKDGSILIQGQTLIGDVQKKLLLPLKGQGYTTIGGLIFGLLGHEPYIGDTVQIGTWIIAIEQIEGKRIKLLRFKREKPAAKRR